MNGGDGETSYAHNSPIQRTGILKVRQVLEKYIKNVYEKSFPEILAIADLGCSSGPNSKLPVSQMVDVIERLSQEACLSPPEIQVHLNDLHVNDFNSVFKSLPSFYEKLKERGVESCFISGAPGSFYGRLFPSTSLHFVHSSYSLHWLSQVPEVTENNKGNISLAKTSPLNVIVAYTEQFKTDFTSFLASRAKEIIAGGQMVMTFLGRNSANPTSNDSFLLQKLVSKSLLDMTKEGLVKEADIDSFNLPYYEPCKREVKGLVQGEGSFSIDHLESFEVNWDPVNNGDNNEDYVFDRCRTGKVVANYTRAALEPLLASHFGDNVSDHLFARFAMYAGKLLSMEKAKHISIVISLTKK